MARAHHGKRGARVLLVSPGLFLTASPSIFAASASPCTEPDGRPSVVFRTGGYVALWPKPCFGLNPALPSRAPPAVSSERTERTLRF